MQVEQTKKIKVYIEGGEKYKNSCGGGFTFLRNLKKGLEGKVEFVGDWKDCDIVFVFGITAIDKTRVHEAVNAGKKLVLRVDNIPRKSRNKRQSPVERLTEFGNKASAVVYQSKWCKEYAGFFIKNDNEVIINNGVDSEIFNSKSRNSDGHTYLYINYNDNPNKRFDEAMYWYDMESRQDPKAKLIIAGNAPKIYIEHPEYNWDLPTNAKVEYRGILDSPVQVASLMRECDYLLYPSFCEAYPNTLLEGMACGVMPLYLNNEGGSKEALHNSIIGVPQYIGDVGSCLKSKLMNPDFKVKTIEEMGEEYLALFNSLI